jgi:hypothetical protein
MLSKVAPEDWDAPEHLSLSERDFLVTRAEAIHGIVAKSYLDVGRVLLQVKRKFKNDPDMSGWFGRWCAECLPFTINTARTYIRIAEEVEGDPELLEVCANNGPTVLYRVLCLPTEARDAVIALLQDGEKVTVQQAKDMLQLPQVELEKAQELVDQLNTTLLKHQLKNDTYNENATKRSLSKALQQLQEAEEKVASLGKSQSVQDAILAQLKRQLKQQEVQIEEINLDPEQKRKRSLAKTVVDATTSLDLLLSAFDRYGTDKPELGVAAIKTIERKLQQVQQRLLEHYATETK